MMSKKKKIAAILFAITISVGSLLIYYLHMDLMRTRESRIYIEKAANIIASAKEIRDDFYDLINQSKNPIQYMDLINNPEDYNYKFAGYSSVFYYLLEKAQQLEPPEKYQEFHSHLTEYLELEAEGFESLHEAIRKSDVALLDLVEKYLLDAEKEWMAVYQSIQDIIS